MIIIGEKINGSIPATAKAIAGRDEAYIRELAVSQTKYGADYLDVCAGTTPDKELETLSWLIDLVQDTVDTPLCIDSSSVDSILSMLPKAKRPGMINSISDEKGKCEKIMPAVAGSGWKLIALTCDNDGVAADPAKKAAIARRLMAQAKEYGIDDDRMYIDPLVMTLATTGTAMLSFMEATRAIKAEFPRVHITSGLSNISFGLPLRKVINREFMVLAMCAGMDSAIMDPNSADLRTTLYTAEALLGQDEDSLRFLKAFRKGIIGTPKA